MARDRRGRPLRAALAACAMWALAASALDAQGTDLVSRAASHGMGWGRETLVLTEVLEYDPSPSARPVLYDIVGWTGGASRRLWFKAEGDVATTRAEAHGEYQVLYGQMLSPFWDVQVGGRTDLRVRDGGTRSRTGVVVGVQGLAPGWFDVEPSVFVTASGNASIDLTASYDLFLTQRLVVQPRVESSVALRDEAEFGIGRGVSSGSLGLRTRYEWRREVAPYVGIVWEREYGRTAELARLAGDAVGATRGVAGLRLWW
jgi:copper resistance protein B